MQGAREFVHRDQRAAEKIELAVELAQIVDRRKVAEMA
jgi:hypothetical protein